MTRSVSVIAVIFGMILAWGFPIMPAAAEPGLVWGTAERIDTDDVEQATLPQIAVDPQGNAVAVWAQFSIWANRFVPGVGWGTAELINDGSGGATPQVAVDPQGNAVAVWAQSGIQANRFVPGVGWGTAELISGVGFPDLPQVAVDSQGNATAVWQQSDGTRNNIWANRFVSGVGWGTAELIETDTGDAGRAQVAVDPQGNATAVWHQFDGTRNNVWANRFVPGVGWGTAELIETDDAGSAGLAQVAVDAQGNATAVWQANDGTNLNISANRFVPGVGWGTAELIETDTGDAGQAQVATNPQGNVTAVWEQVVPRLAVWANHFVPGVGWGTPEVIDALVGSAFRAQVAVDPQGNATAVWLQSNNIWANHFVPGVGWGTAEQIETLGGDAPQVAVDLQGNAVAVWSGSSNIWANRGTVSVTVAVPPTAPQNLQATSGDAQVDLTWAPPSDDGGSPVTGYNIHRGTSSGGETFLTAVGTVPAHTDTSVTNGVTYYYQVSAVNAVGEGARSNEASGTPMPPDTTNPTVTITAPADGAALPSIFVLFSGTASDDRAVEMVELSLDGTNYFLVTGTTSWSSGTVTLAEGPNTIFARATDTSGNTATVSITVTTDISEPTAVAGADQTVNAGDTVSFDASASSDNVGIVSYAWDFGDGATGMGETTTHIYTDPGTYTVNLTVRDAVGNLDTDLLTVTVVTEPETPPPENPPPGFQLSPEVVILGVVGVVAAAAAGVALFLWRRRGRGKGKG